MSFLDQLKSATTLRVRQRQEIGEFFGFETRNKYSIELPDGEQIAFAAEQQKNFLGFFLRQSLGHWRSFQIAFFDASRQPIFNVHHPFRFIFSRLEVQGRDGKPIGSVQQRFALFYKRFDVMNPFGQVVMSVASPVWKIWTFPFTKNGQEVAVICKKWTGFIKESFTDADNFEIKLTSRDLTPDDRLLILAASIYVDLVYFERKASNRSQFQF